MRFRWATGAACALAFTQLGCPRSNPCTRGPCVVASDSMPSGLVVDQGTVYWATYDQGFLWKKAEATDSVQLAKGIDRPQALALLGERLYWGAQSELGALELDGGANAILASNQSGVTALAADPNHLYWTSQGLDSGSVLMADTDGANAGVLAQGQLAINSMLSDGQAVYWVNSLQQVPLFGQDAGWGGLMRATPDGGVSSLWLKNSVGSNALARCGTTLYWGTNDGEVFALDVDGGQPEQLASRGAHVSIWRIACDGSALYWDEFESGLVKLELDGGSPTVWVSAPGDQINSIALDDNFLYWADWTSHQVMQTPK